MSDGNNTPRYSKAGRPVVVGFIRCRPINGDGDAVVAGEHNKQRPPSPSVSTGTGSACGHQNSLLT